MNSYGYRRKQFPSCLPLVLLLDLTCKLLNHRVIANGIEHGYENSETGYHMWFYDDGTYEIIIWDPI